MIPKKIIELSIEGGWKAHKLHSVETKWIILGDYNEMIYFTEIIIDPLFWQSLGKALGWFHKDGQPVAKYINNDPKHTQQDIHIWHAHRFFDLILASGDTAAFWASLISDKK